MTGSVSSVTVKSAEQVSVLPASSVTVIVTEVTPRPTVVPAVGDCVIVSVVSQLSEAVTPDVKSGTVASHEASADAD
jgi:hypothetical protein